MTISPSSFFTRRERSKRVSNWISEELLIEFITGLDEPFLRKNARPRYRASVKSRYHNQAFLPDTGKSWRYARKNGQFYYDYDRIPAERRALLPSKDDLVRAARETQAQDRLQPLRQSFQEAIDAEFKAYLVHYAEETDTRCRELSRAAAVLVAVRREQVRRGVDSRSMTLFKDAERLVKERGGIRYFPRDHRIIKQKALDERPAYDVIKLPRKGNTNSRKWDDPSTLAMLLMMRNDPRNDTSATVRRRFKRLMVLADKKCPSDSWIDMKLAENATKFLTAGRYGSGRYAHQFQTYVPIKGAAYAGDCWQMDGTRINFQAHRTPDGRDKCLFITTVYDVHSRDLVGYALAESEDRWTYVEALDMAVNHTGYLPYELVTDRFPGHNTEEWEHITRRLEKRGTKMTVTSTKTGKALNERFFGTLQSVFLSEHDMYYGEGIQSKSLAAHRSPEHKARALKEAKKTGWTEQDAIRELVPILEKYRDTPLSSYSRRYATITESPRQLHNESDKPSVKVLDDLDRVDLFCMEKALQIRNVNMLRTEINKQVYHYRVADYDTYKNHKRVRVAYDVNDLSRVHLFEDSDQLNRKYLGEALEERAVARYGAEGSEENVAQAKARADRALVRRNEEMAAQEVAAAELAVQYPLLSDKTTVGDAETMIIEQLSNHYLGKTRLFGKPPPPPEEDDDDDHESDLRASLYAQM
jgi:hypothetical protein